MGEETHDAIPHQPWPVGGGVEWTSYREHPGRVRRMRRGSGSVSDHAYMGLLYLAIVTSPPFSVVNGPLL